jgi:hypothetical protein
MGIFKNLINKVLDAEVPPAIEKLVKKEYTEKQDAAKNQRPSDTSSFSMTVEDVFTIPGRGTVAVGKIQAGSIISGEKITVTVGGEQHKDSTVISIEKFNKIVSAAEAGEDVGLLLKGLSVNEVKKGYIVVKAGEGYSSLNIHPQTGSVIYSEREIPDDSEEALKIKSQQDSEKNEIITGMIKDIKSSRFFIPEKIPELLNLLKEMDAWGNNRRNIPNEIINYLSEEGLKQINSKEIISNIYYQNFHKVGRRRDLLRMKQTGIKKVKILDAGDERDCPMIKKMEEKSWPIDEVPELPLPGCTAEYCRCEYIMDEESMFD